MRTTAIDDGTSWVLNGTKRWITNGNLSQVLGDIPVSAWRRGSEHGFEVDEASFIPRYEKIHFHGCCE